MHHLLVRVCGAVVIYLSHCCYPGIWCCARAIIVRDRSELYAICARLWTGDLEADEE